MMRAMISAAALVLVTGAALTQWSRRLVPHGYFTSGAYCVPSEGAQDAVPRPPSGT